MDKNVLLPKVGNQDDIHGYIVDMLVAMQIEARSRATFDASNWLGEEMPGEPLTSPHKLIEHEVKQLRNKKHLSPRFPTTDPEDVFATSSDDDFELPAEVAPSWVSKLSYKLKKTFCLQTHVQKKLYEAHVDEKLAKCRHIRIMRALQLEAASGSEKTIAPEEQCICAHSTWTDDEILGQPAASSSPAADDDAMMVMMMMGVLVVIPRRLTDLTSSTKH
ncbi:hypothetical protein D1007_13489 [Hordeum vulgare]|nr:hypothetical protein D1007_13489 [Hordeum vulgare]